VIAQFMTNRYHPSHEEYIGALADAMKEEYEAIAAAGLVLQVDCPDLASWPVYEAKGMSKNDFLAMVDQHIEALNSATAAIAPESMRMHVCWGNYEGPHNHDIPLIEIIDRVLRARPAALLFEAANPRHEHEWAIFNHVVIPDGKVLVPGLLDTTTNYIEHPELVAERIERIARIVGMERVLAGTDCGFATFAHALPVDPRIVWAKLASMVEGAAIATRRLRS
jgi:5-methyltetrahydropteroyltriglutamate--homocysteine methyltransferase